MERGFEIIDAMLQDGSLTDAQIAKFTLTTEDEVAKRRIELEANAQAGAVPQATN